MAMLDRTYDACSELVGREIGNDPVLLPIAHSTANAQLELTVDLEGHLVSALTRTVEKEGGDEVTIIPVTEDSAARSNGIFPHPFCDKLCYVAGDYGRYTGEDREAYFSAYLALLGKWARGAGTHPWVQAVYAYVQKGHMIEELVSMGLLKTGGDGLLSDQDNIQNSPQKDAFVRFAIWDGERKRLPWKSAAFYDSYIEHYRQEPLERDICYVSGNREICTDKHPSKIRNSADKAKLISGNDDSGFTYRGRFEKKEEAVRVGFETSQKAHNALRWLLQKQGYRRDGSAMVVWRLPGTGEQLSAEELSVPDIFEGSENAFGIDWGEVFPADGETEQNARDTDTGSRYAHLLNEAIAGYRGRLTADDRVIWIAVDAATKGRLSVTDYHEFSGNRFIDSVISWHQTCRWRRNIKLRNCDKRVWVDSAPSPREMALAAFGTERGKNLACEEKLLRSTVQRILPCITGLSGRIPPDIVRSAANRASNPQAYSPYIWENQVLAVTCAMLRYNREKGKKEEAMDTERERAILFGRLLALADEAERKALYSSQSEGDRLTNAKKLWSVYARRPKATFCRLYGMLTQTYLKRLSGGTRRFMENETDAIMVRLGEIDGFCDRPLQDDYLLGYCEERNKIRTYHRDGGNAEEEGGQE